MNKVDKLRLVIITLTSDLDAAVARAEKIKEQSRRLVADREDVISQLKEVIEASRPPSQPTCPWQAAIDKADKAESKVRELTKEIKHLMWRVNQERGINSEHLEAIKKYTGDSVAKSKRIAELEAQLKAETYVLNVRENRGLRDLHRASDNEKSKIIARLENECFCCHNSLELSRKAVNELLRERDKLADNLKILLEPRKVICPKCGEEMYICIRCGEISHIVPGPQRGFCNLKQADSPEASAWECDECGDTWQLTDGSPRDNNMNYCQNCGRKIVGIIGSVEEESEQ